MTAFAPGDRVRIDTPDETGSGFDAPHAREGRVVAVLTEGRRAPSCEYRQRPVYRVSLDRGGDRVFVESDLRPSLD
jgi:hypothetical protein